MNTFEIRALISRKGLRGLTIAEAVQAYNTMAEGNARDQQLARTVERAFPNLAAYDEHGNYIGSIANENGWTA